MPFSEHKDIIRTYIQAVRAIDARQANEHTYRTPLENLINQLPFKGKNIVAEQEVKGAELDVDGTQDFYVYDASCHFLSL